MGWKTKKTIKKMYVGVFSASNNWRINLNTVTGSTWNGAKTKVFIGASRVALAMGDSGGYDISATPTYSGSVEFTCSFRTYKVDGGIINNIDRGGSLQITLNPNTAYVCIQQFAYVRTTTHLAMVAKLNGSVLYQVAQTITSPTVPTQRVLMFEVPPNQNNVVIVQKTSGDTRVYNASITQYTRTYTNDNNAQVTAIFVEED